MRGARVLLRLPAGHPGRAQLAARAHAAAVRAAERQRHAREPARMLAVRHIALRVRLAALRTLSYMHSRPPSLWIVPSTMDDEHGPAVACWATGCCMRSQHMQQHVKCKPGGPANIASRHGPLRAGS